MKSLTRKEIGTVSARVLNMRYCRLIKKGETMPAGVITYGDMKEILWIEGELRIRLIKLLGRDVYPPDRVEKKYPSNYMISLLKPNQHKPKTKPGIKINFKVAVISSIGSKAAEFKVQADSKAEAGLLANEKIRELGLKRATYKIL